MSHLLYLTVASLQAIGGTYSGQAWQITENRTLMWAGKPYLPVGWRFVASPTSVAAVAASGAKDVILELPPQGDWAGIIRAAETVGMRYLIAPAEAAPKCPAFLIKPETYRIDNVGPRGEFTIPIENARNAYYVLVSKRGFSVEASGWVDVIDGVAKIKVDQRVQSEAYTLLVYPRQIESRLTDYWEGFDTRRDAFLRQLMAASPGPNMRGIVSPLGSVDIWTSYTGGYVPDSELFRLEFQTYLESRYRGDVDALIRAWRLRAIEIDTFQEAARLVPLFSKHRGVDRLLDPQNNRLISVDNRQSTYWTDLQTVIDNAAARRTKRFAQAIRQVVDVPVIYEWSGWSPIYDTADAAGDGLGIRAYGIGLQPIEDSAAEAASTAIAWRNKGWLVATELAASRGVVPYPDSRSLTQVVLDLAELGTKGWFVRWTGGSESQLVSELATRISEDATLVSIAPRALFYPENARHPADTMRLPGGVWWLPTPAAGNRLDLGSKYEAYRHSAPYATFTAIWRRESPTKVKLLYADPAKVSIVTHDGRPVQTKLLRDGIELAMDTMPVLIFGTDDIPVPADAVDAIQAEYLAFVNAARGTGAQIGDYRFLFEDSLSKIKTHPSGAFASMVDSLRKIQAIVGPDMWIEAEEFDDSNFGQVVQSSACAGGRAVEVITHIRPEGGYFCSYRPAVRQGSYELWVAARVPADLRAHIVVEVGGNRMSLPDSPQSNYGPGFAWYKVGSVDLPTGSHTIAFRVLSTAPSFNVALDAIVLSPRAFAPRGPLMPDTVKR